MKLTKTARKTIFGMLLILGLLLPVFMNVSKADHGPKPSITINVKNGPAAGFIALLEEGGNRENSFAEREEARMKEKHPGEREQQALETLFHYSSTGYCIHVPPSGSYCFKVAPSGSYRFTYMVPTRFRVIIVTLEGQVILSNPVTKNKYNAVFDYDAATGEITESKEKSQHDYVVNVITCYILTIIIEAIFFAWFELSSSKNWLRFWAINTVTQVLLNIYLLNAPKGNGGLIGLILAEIIICAIEAAFYCMTLRRWDKKISPRVCIWYAVVANAASFLLGLLIFDKSWGGLF